MRSLLRLNLAPAAVCLLLLGAVVAERSRRLTPADVAPYHARAAAAVPEVRYTIGYWTGVDIPVPEAAQQLLRPNALLSRSYVDNDPRSTTPGARASLLIVQCRDPRDMQGHYPPICYVAHGQTLASSTPTTIDLPGLTLHTTEYRFNQLVGGRRTAVYVLNTLLIPGVGSTPDMAGVYRAAEDYQRRLYGAAQVQIVLAETLPPDRRKQVYREFLTSLTPTLQALLDPYSQPAAALNRAQ